MRCVYNGLLVCHPAVYAATLLHRQHRPLCFGQVLLGVCRGAGSAILDLGIWFADRIVKETGSAEAIPPGWVPPLRVVPSLPTFATPL
jgi:hypothetical protein